MEIDTNGPILMSECFELNKDTEKPLNNEFEKILKKLTKNPEDAEDGKIQAINKTSAIPLSPFLPVGESSVIENAEKMLDILDEYQQKLANPKTRLREISPLIDKLEMDKEGLLSAVNSLHVGEELKHILNNMVIISSIEIIKFSRGDYVNS